VTVEGQDWIKSTMSLSNSLQVAEYSRWVQQLFSNLKEALSIATSVWPYCTATSTAASSALLMVSVGPLPPGLLVTVSL